jgi:hypothetical protein
MRHRKLNRRSILLLAPLALLPLRTLPAQQAGSSFNNAESLKSARNVTPLIDQLRLGLRTNQASQVDFLKLVVKKVEDGEISQAMVNTVYKWAISRNDRYPFPYFQVGLKELAKRRGVSL